MPAHPSPAICRLCGGRTAAPFPAFAESWRRCLDCGGISIAELDARPGEAAARPTPDAERMRSSATAASRGTLRTRAALVRRLAPGRRVLDIGAGRGEFVAEARALGLDAFGIETSDTARREAEAAGIALEAGPLESLGNGWHAITLWDVLGREADPPALVRAARRLLVPGGVLSITTPNSRGLGAWLWGRRWPALDRAREERLHHLSRESVAALLDRAGLSLIHSETRGIPDLRDIPRDLLPGRGKPPGRVLGWLLEQCGFVLRPFLETFELGDWLTAHGRR